MPEQPPANDPMATFGPNEWLVDELYQRYLQDKNSVDEAWWEFFADYHPAVVANDDDQRLRYVGGPGGRRRRTRRGPHPCRRLPPATTGAAARQPPPRSPAAAPRASQPAADTVEPAETAPKSRDLPRVIPTGPLSEDEVQPLRGAAARTVVNMESSLTVPTATSVRTVPAKLLMDNRVVINNHLARSRGGKVSFTHLIGYAIVKALALMPQMNNGFGERDGKPVLITPAHVNLGLAIDIPKPDGTRTLLVPSIKSTEAMDFSHFWTAYEDVVRKARNNKLTVEDFQGTTISLTNPGHDRHRPLRASADVRPGRDHRRRRAGVPRRVAGREPGDVEPQRRQQDHHHHLDL